jgi:hypothetical protein
MRTLLLPLVVLWSFAMSAQSYFSPDAAAQKLQNHQGKLSELHLKLLAREAVKGGYEAQWKKIYKEALALEGILACADSDWYYQQFEPQLYRAQDAANLDPELFFNELTRLVALTSYKYEAIGAAYERGGCAKDGVREAVRAGRAAHVRPRPALKGITEGSN